MGFLRLLDVVQSWILGARRNSSPAAIFTVSATSLHSRSLHALSTDGNTASASSLISGKTSDELGRMKAVPFGSRDLLARNDSEPANVAQGTCQLAGSLSNSTRNK